MMPARSKRSTAARLQATMSHDLLASLMNDVLRIVAPHHGMSGERLGVFAGCCVSLGSMRVMA